MAKARGVRKVRHGKYKARFNQKSGLWNLRKRKRWRNLAPLHPPPEPAPMTRNEVSKAGQEARNRAQGRLIEKYRREFTELINEERAKRNLPRLDERPQAQRRRKRHVSAVAPPLVTVVRPKAVIEDILDPKPPKPAPQTVAKASKPPAAPTGPKTPAEQPACTPDPKTTSTACKHANRRVLGWGTVCNDCGKVIKP